VTGTGGKQAGSSRKLLRPVLWLLGWALIAFPIARAQLAETAVANRVPGKALLFDAGHARALAGVAAAIQVQGDQQQAMALARAALTREPMNVTALRTLGLALERAGDQAGANRIMFLAAGLGWRDVGLQLWLIKAYALKNDVFSALRRANALARTNHLPEITYPLFLASITDDQLRPALAQQMADRPLWRGNFFYRLLQLPANQMPYVEKLVSELAKLGSPINPQERAIYLTRLVQVGQGQAAYAYWLREQRIAGGDASLLAWDGGFEHVPPVGALGAPFEWRLSPESTGVVGIIPSSKEGQQLSVSPGHDFSGTLVSQMVVLQPGRYRLAARVEGDAASAGLRWTIRCLPANNELALNAGLGDAEFGTVTFAVPAGNCAAQTLAIDMGSGGGDAGGDVTIDDLSIRKIG
jgi:hypothetical protein